MITHNIPIYGDIEKIFPELSSDIFPEQVLLIRNALYYQKTYLNMACALIIYRYFY